MHAMVIRKDVPVVSRAIDGPIVYIRQRRGLWFQPSKKALTL